MKNTYILVHGAWHAGWAWDEIANKLRSEGHSVIAPDLPGHGKNTLELSDVSLEVYVDSIAELVNIQEGKVILVGHSMSGAVIAQVAEQYPQKIDKLVYLCAFLLSNGQSVLEVMQTDENAEFSSRLSFNEEQNGGKFDEATFRETFYNTASEEKIKSALQMMPQYQAIAPLGTPISVTDENFGSIPRIYIKCMQDKVLSPKMQQKLIDAQRCNETYELDSDHAPFASKSLEVAKILLNLS